MQRCDGALCRACSRSCFCCASLLARSSLARLDRSAAAAAFAARRSACAETRLLWGVGAHHDRPS
jgi:hypothetical protein